MSLFWILFFVWLGVGAFWAVADLVFLAHRVREPRSRIDWEHVYAMEREVWKRTFDHLGAPAPRHEVVINRRHLIASGVDREAAAEYLTRHDAPAAYFHSSRTGEYRPLTGGQMLEWEQLKDRMDALDALIQVRETCLSTSDVIKERTRAAREERAQVWERMKELLPLD